MKKLLLGVLGLILMVSPSYAIGYRDSTNKTFLQSSVGGFYSNTNTNLGPGVGAQVTQPGIPITGLMLSGGASGGTVSIYDSGFMSGTFNATECAYEATIGSNTQNYVDLSQAPINTQNGIVVIATSTAGVIIYQGTGTTNK